jgi:hypothetical protein
VGPDHHEPRTYRLRVLHDHLDTETLDDGDFTRRTGVTEHFFETTFRNGLELVETFGAIQDFP